MIMSEVAAELYESQELVNVSVHTYQSFCFAALILHFVFPFCHSRYGEKPRSGDGEDSCSDSKKKDKNRSGKQQFWTRQKTRALLVVIPTGRTRTKFSVFFKHCPSPFEDRYFSDKSRHTSSARAFPHSQGKEVSIQTGSRCENGVIWLC